VNEHNKIRPPRRAARPSLQAEIPAEFKIISLRECPINNPILDNPRHLVNFWRRHVTKASWFNACKECLCVFFLNTRKQLTGFELASQGNLDTILVHSRDIFRSAIIHSSAAVLVAHNHPSGNPAPSEADIKVTRDMMRAGQLLGIELRDHIIIGDARLKRGFASLRELGYFYR
jgi:DNA repair protein RadC